MAKTVAVSGTDTTDIPFCDIEVDGYIPLSFRSYEDILVVKCVRFGNFVNSLLEIKIDPVSFAIRAFVLVGFDVVHTPLEMRVLPRTFGLPILEIVDSFAGAIDAQHIDIQNSFSVGIGGDFIEIDLCDMSSSNFVIVAGDAEFYTGTSGLVGIRIGGLTSHQLSTIASQRIV